MNGFTMVELMVSVAIIGIMVSVAMPRYENFRAKAINSEALLLLSGVATAEQTFYLEYETFAPCIEYLGVVKPASHYFSYGFNVAIQTSVTDAITANAGGTAAADCTAGVSHHQGTKGPAGPPAPITDEANVFFAGNTGYLIGALGGATQTAKLDLELINKPVNSSPLDLVFPKAYAQDDMYENFPCPFDDPRTCNSWGYDLFFILEDPFCTQWSTLVGYGGNSATGGKGRFFTFRSCTESDY